MMPHPRIKARHLARWLRGEADLATLLGLSPDDRDRLGWQAHRALADGRIEEAERLFGLLGQLWPGSIASARLGQGVCRQALGDLAGAERGYDECLAVEPANIHALANRAEVRLLGHRPAEAVTDLAQARAALDADGGPIDLSRRIDGLGELADPNILI